MNLDIFQRLLCRNHNEIDYGYQDIAPDEILMNRLNLINPEELPKITMQFNQKINSKIKKSDSQNDCMYIDTKPTCYSCHFLIELCTECYEYIFRVKNID